MEREKYEKLKPLSKDEILDAMGKLSQEAAGHEAAEEGLKERRKDAKKQYDAAVKQMRDIACAHKEGRPVYALKDGHFTTQPPDKQMELVKTG